MPREQIFATKREHGQNLGTVECQLRVVNGTGKKSAEACDIKHASASVMNQN